jgi:hypothetical protein
MSQKAMNALEKYLLAADIVFSLLVVWFFFPRCKIQLWMRLIFVVFVWGINAAVFYYDNNVMWLFHHSYYYRPPCLWVALAAIFSWRGRYSWNEWSNRFEQKNRLLLWGVVIAIFLLIPIVVYLILH